jgi:GTP cyclohydrolase I
MSDERSPNHHNGTRNGAARIVAPRNGATANGAAAAVAPPTSALLLPADRAGRLQTLTHELLLTLGEDTSREGLRATPGRVQRSLEFLTQGYGQDPREVVGDALFPDSGEELVLVRDVELYSLCEHHLLPFFGRVQIGYRPNGKVIGLSKLPRLVDVFARRLQIQERLSRQIAEAVLEVTGAHGVGVVIEASHLCVMMRGVEQRASTTVTSALLGSINEDPRERDEFLAWVRR